MLYLYMLFYEKLVLKASFFFLFFFKFEYLKFRNPLTTNVSVVDFEETKYPPAYTKKNVKREQEMKQTIQLLGVLTVSQNTGFLWPVFSRITTESRENTYGGQEKAVICHILRSANKCAWHFLTFLMKLKLAPTVSETLFGFGAWFLVNGCLLKRNARNSKFVIINCKFLIVGFIHCFIHQYEERV